MAKLAKLLQQAASNFAEAPIAQAGSLVREQTDAKEL